MNKPRPQNTAQNDAQAPDQASLPGLATRQAAAALISAVCDNHLGLDALLGSATGPRPWRALDPRDRSLAIAITKAALRHRALIAAMLARLLERPLPDTARAANAILHAAVAQIAFLRVPDSAAVNLAVAAAHADPQAKRYAGLINAVLRRMGREHAALRAELASSVAEAPDWLLAALSADYGEGTARAILAAHAHEPPLDLTVTSDAEGWAGTLGGIVLPTGTVRLAHEASGSAIPVPELAGFADGAWWVQDAAAALPVQLLGDVNGLAVADLCAAPGGKTAQLAAAGATVTALDIAKNRLARLDENLARLNLRATTICADARSFTPPALFDAVLLDAPCSSTGTLRRHPDVAWTKTPADIANLTRIQFELLDAALRLVRPGGLIVYANCALLKAEGEHLLARWLAANPACALVPVTAARDGPALAAFADADGCLRTTPLDLPHAEPALAGMDGFFAARLMRLK